MDPTTQAALLVLLGVVLGTLAVLAWRGPSRSAPPPAVPRGTPDLADLPMASPSVIRVLGVLRSSTLLLDEDDHVVHASAPAYAMGLVREGEVRNAELLDLVSQVRRDGQIRQTELELRRRAQPPLHVTARVAALDSRMVLVLAEDRTRERRVEAIRRDFVANVSHELKTPVGALTLLAEAVCEAADDPEAVQRFSRRMEMEAVRLNKLVAQIIQLSRLQDDQMLERPETVKVDRVVEHALEFNEVEAKAKDIDVTYDGRYGLEVLGDREQIGLALSNLVANAVAYSEEGGRVVVSALPHELMVDITVTDEGIGISREEQDRIFERFYRVDPARHRSTGGTGLGLSIVKHVATTHGGDVSVWSEPGQGSSFTLRLPRRTRLPAADERTSGGSSDRIVRVGAPARTEQEIS